MFDDITFNLGDFDEWNEGLYMRSYTADFETTTDPDDCRVWAWAVCDINNPELIVYGNDISKFINYCECAANCQMYFHNLGFDGSFIMDYLLNNGWRWAKDRKDVSDKSFTTLISDMNMVYSITLYFTPTFKVKLMDSFKVVPLSIEAMAKAYNLPILKGSLDYEKYREVGHVLTEEEKDYIKNDVQIAAMVMKSFLDEGLSKMTAGSNALYNFKQLMGGSKNFRFMYPVLEEEADVFIRKAYRGGFTYVNPQYQGKKIGEGIVFDVNSLYPSVMASCDGQLLPHGQPEWFDGEPIYKKRRPLWVALVTCRFKVKEGYLPTIQLKGNFRFKQTEYLSDSKEEVTFAVTNVDWDLITRHYDLYGVKWFGGYYFKASDCMFQDYVTKWIEVKNNATIEGNAGKRQIAKLMLNSLYGKFATRTTVKSRYPEMIDDVLHYIDMEPTTREPVYLPVGVFITSYARYKTITAAQSVYDRFIYADTDSLHLIGTEIPDNLDVDNVRLGAWKHESTFSEAKFLRAKCYVEHEIGRDVLTVHVSGMPARCHSQVDVDNFDFGATYEGKLYQHRVKGGIVLVPDKIQIRE